MIACGTFLEQLQDYLDEFLSETDRTEMETHLGGCDSCREELTAFQHIMHEASQLPQSIEPDRDLWEGIVSRIETEAAPNVVSFPGRARVVLKRGLAVAAGFMVISTVAFYALTEPYEKPTTLTVETPEVDLLKHEYESAKTVLLNALEERREELPEDVLATVEENLSIIENAMVDIGRALEDHPDDPKLKQMLQSARQTDLDVLQVAIQMENDS
jgi:hypothetical protein